MWGVFADGTGLIKKNWAYVISVKTAEEESAETVRTSYMEGEKDMIKITRAAAIPLVVHDPYFSVWSGADRLYDEDPIHWSGKRQQIRGYLSVGAKRNRFMGADPLAYPMEQVSVSVSAASTEYVFSVPGAKLTLLFTTPAAADDLTLLSRPCTYIDTAVEMTSAAEASIEFTVSKDLVSKQDSKLIGLTAPAGPGTAFSYAMMGRACQRPLGDSDDNSTIDWGYVYLATQDAGAHAAFDPGEGRLVLRKSFTAKKARLSAILAYDDLLSVNYFGQWQRAYWTGTYGTILDAIGAAFSDREETLKRAKQLDQRIEKDAKKAGGDDYAFLCVMSYRHTMAAHKLIADEDGNAVFLSRENDSNSCIGTVDVSYPSVPLLLLENPELVKGLLRPVFRFADCPVWEYDFAPHDVGRYPYAWGQVYGLKADPTKHDGSGGSIFPPFYQYPAGLEIYDHRYQMPVEESGNMVIMTAAVCMAEGDGSFALPYMETLKTWTEYLLKYGEDPGEQLCTDDFAGHLAHNTNLAVKAIMGVEAFSILLKMNGKLKEAAEYHERAAAMAQSWEERAEAGNHYRLCFDREDSWSLKYNMVWDKIFQSGLFSENVAKKEISWYLNRANAYGTPLDSRASYTKSDWLLWIAAMAEKKADRKAIIAPVAKYLRETSSRYPFSDWYDTVSGAYCHFKGRSVQGGIFMPMYADFMDRK